MNYTDLLSTVSDVHDAALRGAAKVVNRLHVLRNWTVGCLIVEFEQRGEDRAAYGEGLLKRLGTDLASKGLMGLGLSNLKNCRTFYRIYPQIGQTASGQFGELLVQLGKGQTASGLLAPPGLERPASSLASLSGGKEPPPLPAEILLRLSWSQFVEFIRLDDPWQRRFYENECLKGGWTVSELQRQIGSLLYERTGLSTDKQAVLAHAHQHHGDAGQMNYYLNYWKDQVMQPGDEPPVGLILCTDKKQTRVNYATAGMDQQLFVSRYLTLLPSPESLQHLIEQDTAVWQQNHPAAD